MQLNLKNEDEPALEMYIFSHWHLLPVHSLWTMASRQSVSRSHASPITPTRNGKKSQCLQTEIFSRKLCRGTVKIDPALQVWISVKAVQCSVSESSLHRCYILFEEEGGNVGLRSWQFWLAFVGKYPESQKHRLSVQLLKSITALQSMSREQASPMIPETGKVDQFHLRRRKFVSVFGLTGGCSVFVINQEERDSFGSVSCQI